MKKNILLAALTMQVLFASAQELKSLDPKLKLNQVALISAHNSYSSKAYGFVIDPQQEKSITDLLKIGVRGIDLDIYETPSCGEGQKPTNNLICEQGNASGIRLCHGGCPFTVNSLQYQKTREARAKGEIPMPMSLSEAFAEIVDFLKNNPDEILILTFESYKGGGSQPLPPFNNGLLFDKFVTDSGLKDFVLKPQDWDVVANDGWPTIGYMRKNNKRVVLFSQDIFEGSALAFYYYKYAVVGWWGKTTAEGVCEENALSTDRNYGMKRFLLALNLITSLTAYGEVKNITQCYLEDESGNKTVMPITGCLNRVVLKDVIDYCKNTGMLLHSKKAGSRLPGRMPNLISLDYAHQGDGIKTVNEINEASAKAAPDELATMWATW